MTVPQTPVPHQPAVWVDGDPLMEAIAAAIRATCEQSESGLIVDDPQTIAATATQTAVGILGRDRCTCRQAVHAQHHLLPVGGCPWCSRTSPSDRTPDTPTTPGMVVVPTGDFL